MVSKMFPEFKIVRTTRVGGSRDNGLLSIKADLTLKRREPLSRLRQELEKRKSRGEKDITIWYIRGYPRIVPLSENLNHLTVCYHNVRGLRSKIAVFMQNVYVSSYEIILFTEIWLDYSISDLELQLQLSSYNICRTDRSSSTSEKTRAGGYLIAR